MVIQTYLPAGEYLVVASTIRPNEEGDFLLRVYAEGKIDASRDESDEATAVTKPEAAPFDIEIMELSPEERKKIEEHEKHAEAEKSTSDKLAELKDRGKRLSFLCFKILLPSIIIFFRCFFFLRIACYWHAVRQIRAESGRSSG